MHRTKFVFISPVQEVTSFIYSVYSYDINEKIRIVRIFFKRVLLVITLLGFLLPHT
jgi:hypothetical protein